uniref:Uncharacterized protein n=1 Tax=Anguilla anguilla TaxID=7936 RepID=A0A0E9PHV4_ANGAN
MHQRNTAANLSVSYCWIFWLKYLLLK